MMNNIINFFKTRYGLVFSVIRNIAELFKGLCDNTVIIDVLCLSIYIINKAKDKGKDKDKAIAKGITKGIDSGIREIAQNISSLCCSNLHT